MKIGSYITISNAEVEAFGISKIREDLTLPNPEYTTRKRFGKGRFFGPKIESHICYLRKEGDNYILPRYYFNTDIELTDAIRGREITSECSIKLRDYQEEFILEHEALIDKSSGILIEMPCGHGKCHGKGTKLLMYDGSVKCVEDIVVGDLLMGDDSTPRRVLSLARGREELFKVRQNKGEDYVVNRSHILTLQYRPYGRNSDKSRFGEVVDISLEDYLKLPASVKRHYYGFCTPIEYSRSRTLPVDSYLIGLWLGDGLSTGVSFACDHRDRQLITYYRQVAETFGCKVSMRRQRNHPNGKRNNSNIYTIIGKGKTNALLDEFRKLNLIGNKHIPADYLIASKEDRLKLLAGLIDTDGSYSNFTLEITQKRKSLAEDIRKLCWSLGYRVKMTEKVVKDITYWRLIISGNIHEIPTRLRRKKILPRTINKDPHVTAISIESIGEGDYYGFTLDGNHRYCLWDSTVTHNTLMAIWLAYQHGVQTMVLVPTYYLAKQWKERLEQFTTASVTLLKSTDTEIPTDSDFTIVVMDLFSCRTLPKEFIRNVGHVILDEAHRVGAETYLPILDEIPAYYRTALTATFRRTDGVHRILKYHFGEHLKMTNRFPRPFAYGIKTGVRIRNIVSKNRPHENFLDFLDTQSVDYHETNGAIEFGGNLGELRSKVDSLMKSKSITKTAHREIASCLKKGSELSYPVVESYLNDHSGRRKLAIRMIQKCLDEGRTILFLSKRKDTLKSLSKYFSKYNPMLIVSETNSRSDEDERYLQESCPLIFGVTQLAKEGLDIDRLDTLIIHLPMKDTEQAIGRIARLCDDKKTPLCLYMLDDGCPITYATYTNAKKYFNINAEHRGERTFDQLNWKCLE